MNLDKPQSRYLNFVNVDFLSTTSYRSFVYTGQYLFIRVYTSTNARRPNGCPLSPTLCAPLRGIRELPQNNMNTSPRQPRQYPPYIPTPMHSVFPMPEEIGNLIDLELEFTLDIGYRLFDTLDDTAITQHENGYTVKLTLPENDWLYDFLMSFGNKVTIIRPKSIRQALKAKHEAARDHHKGD